MDMTRRIQHPLARYVIAFAITLATYGLYAQFVVPIVEPRSAEIPRRPSTNQDYRVPIDDKSTYQHLFQSDDWELKLCKTLETKQGKILFLNYKRHEDETWDVYPFTMILEPDIPDGEANANAGKTTPPFVLRSLKGARLSFDRSLEFSGGKKSATLERAQLLGEVDLFRASTAPDKNDAVKIKTSNVQVTETRIFTLDNVWFEFGKNRGQGRNLSVDLTHNTPKGSISTDFSKINGVERVQLAFLKSMRLEPSSAQPMATGNAQDQLFSSKNNPVEITANGSFEFDVNSSEARFRDQVVVRTLVDAGDTLHCDLLNLKFKTDAVTKEINLNQPTQAEYELQMITAVGSPCRLQAHSQNAYVVGERLEYDLVQSRVEVRGTQPVEIGKDNSRFLARQISYRLPDDRRLGSLDAVGPGQMTRKDTAGDRLFFASWQDLLTIRPEGSQTKLVTMEGATTVRLDTQTSIQSQGLQLWLWESPVRDQAARVVSWNYQPQKLVATTNVRINAPELQGGATDKLIATWPANPQAPSHDGPQIGRRSGPGNNRSNSDVVQSFYDQDQNLIRQRKTRTADARFSDSVVRRVNYQQDPVPKKTPLEFQGDRVEVALQDLQNQTQITDLTVTGNVHVWKKPQQAGQPGMDIKGQFLRAIPQQNELHRIQVTGGDRKLASVHSTQLQLAGQNIQLDQAANRLWVEGPGTMKIVGKPPSPDQRAAENLSPLSSRTINLSWEGGMIFDGQKLYFEKNVASNTVEATASEGATQTQTLSAALSVMLARRVDFQNLERGNNDSSKLDIREMIFVEQLLPDNEAFRQVAHSQPIRQPVVFEHQTLDTTGQVQDVIKVIAPHATVRAAENQIVAHGPGSLIIYRRGNPGKKGTGLGFARDINTPSNGLTFVQINFDKSLVGNTQSQEFEIAGNLRSIYAPVNNLQQQFNPDKTDRLPNGGMRLTCDTIKMSRWTPRATGQETSEMIAAGNAQITSDTLQATAERFSYNQQTDILTIEGTSRTDANLWFRRTAQEKMNHLVAVKILYRLGDQWTDVQNVKNATFSPGRR